MNKTEATERVKRYRQIHASNFYKNMVKAGGVERWRAYLTERFGVDSCKLLTLEQLKALVDGLYKQNVNKADDGKVVSLLPMINEKQLREQGREAMTNKQSWRIKRSWDYLTQYLNPAADPVKALQSYIARVCGGAANFENLTKKQAQKLIAAIDGWTKSIEG